MRKTVHKSIFLSKSKLGKPFLASVIKHLESGRKDKSSEEKEIISNIVRSLKGVSSVNKSEVRTADFTILPNEYNFLIQNDKSLWVDYLIFRYRFKVYPTFNVMTDFPTHLLVEPVSYCNLKCPMCFQSDKTFTVKKYLGHMSMKLFKKVVDEAVEHRCMALTMASRGEPLLHPEFNDILKYAKDKFFDLKLNTNAMLLNEEKSRQILENGITELVFSVDSARKDEYERIRRNGKFEQVVNNIKQFHKIREKEYPDSKCRTRVSGVKDPAGFGEKEFISFWKRYVDNIACVPMEERWDTYNNNPDSSLSPCRYLWERMYIWFDGTANPCDYDYKSCLSIGNVMKRSIKDVWGGREFAKLRDDHLKGNRKNHFPCDRCGYQTC